MCSRNSRSGKPGKCVKNTLKFTISTMRGGWDEKITQDTVDANTVLQNQKPSLFGWNFCHSFAWAGRVLLVSQNLRSLFFRIIRVTPIRKLDFYDPVI